MDETGLEGKINVKLKLGNFFIPGEKLSGRGLHPDVKDVHAEGELDRLELVDEPLREVRPVVSLTVVEQRGTVGPDTGKHEEELIQLLGSIWRHVGRDDEGGEVVAEHLDVVDHGDRSDLLELLLDTVLQSWQVFVKQHGQVRLDKRLSYLHFMNKIK